ncbi:MAG: hypothetical protein ABFR33_11990, partial [Verrucomicrobiota bacterium]
DRPAMRMGVPRDNAAVSPRPEPVDFKQKWTDPDFVVKSFIPTCEEGAYVAESIPTNPLLVGYAFAYNAELHFSKQTISHRQLFNSAEEYAAFDFDYENDWGWNQSKKVLRAMGRVGKGKFTVGIPTIIQGNDLLSVLRNPVNFLMDLVDEPDAVKKTLKKMNQDWIAATEECFDILKEEGIEGSTTWLGIWSPKKTVTLQSDVSCMMSPDMFDEFIMPEIEECAKRFDHAFYHLDGADAVKHLDRLLEVPEIFGIQFGAGVGHSNDIEEWLPMYKKIQAAGKGLCPPPLPKEKLELALRELNPRGLFLTVSGAGTIQGAESILKSAEEYTAKYWK